MPRSPKDDDQGFRIIRNYFIHTGRAPSFQTIADEMGYVSKRSVQLMLRRLTSSGRITYENGRIGLLGRSFSGADEETVKVDILGRVPCGSFDVAEQHVEGQIDVSTLLAKPPHKYFILRAKGNSMDLSGIDDGSLVLIREQATAQPGQIIVALVDGEATIKHFHPKGDLVMLKPNSSDKSIRPLILTEALIIQGVVVRALPDPFEF
jgi:repressor LexA